MNTPAPGETTPRKRSGILAAAICCVFLISFALISWFAWLHKCATFDEPMHFVSAWIQTHYNDYRCNPEDPPLWKYYVAAGTNADDMKLDHSSYLWPMMLIQAPSPALHFASNALYRTPGNDADALFRAARVRMLALGVLLGAAIAWWAWRLAGAVAAVVACAAFSLDPNFLAHAALVKNDVPISLVFFVMMGFVWLLGRRATLGRIIAVALMVGVALTTKFSGVAALPMIGIALLIRALLPAKWQFLCWRLVTRGQRIAAAAGVVALAVLVGWGVIWASYDFRFGVSENPNLQLYYPPMLVVYAENEMLEKLHPVPPHPDDELIRRLLSEWQPDHLVTAAEFADRHHLLPQAWIYGFVYTWGSSMARLSFFCGEIRLDGWWYYFPAAMAFKTPLATLIALAFAGTICLSFWRQKSGGADAWTIAAAAVCPVFYMALAMHGHLDIGLRHVLPVYPFLYLFLGVMAARAMARWPRAIAWILLLLLAGLACETLSAFPDYIPFFNVAVGGSRGGLALLSDSNIDWGQDLPSLARWQQEHPDNQLYLRQFGEVDPHYYGLHYISMKGGDLMEAAIPQKKPKGPPMYAISAVALQGTYMDPPLIHYYRQFLRERPVDVLNGSIYLYDHAPAK